MPWTSSENWRTFIRGASNGAAASGSGSAIARARCLACPGGHRPPGIAPPASWQGRYARRQHFAKHREERPAKYS